MISTTGVNLDLVNVSIYATVLALFLHIQIFEFKTILTYTNI